MRFWDTSAVAPLLVEEPNTPRVRGLIERDEEMAAWWATPVECWSALARLRREGSITPETEDTADKRLEMLRSAWYEIVPSEEVCRHARRLLRVHALRAADGLQLAAALVWSAHTDGEEFVSFDARLKEAARLEGFAIV